MKALDWVETSEKTNSCFWLVWLPDHINNAWDVYEHIPGDDDDGRQEGHSTIPTYASTFPSPN